MNHTNVGNVWIYRAQFVYLHPMKEQKRDKKAMTPARIRFCEEYVQNGGNATRAYLAAYPRVTKDVTAKADGYNLLRDPSIQEHIAYLQEDLRRHSEVTRQEVLQFVTSAMRVDIRDYLTVKEGKVTLKDSDEWTPEMARLVEGVRETKHGIALTLAGKTWSVERICKMLGYDSPEKLQADVRSVVNFNLEVDEEMARAIRENEGI